MSVPDSSAGSGSEAGATSVAVSGSAGRTRLHQPWRAVLAVVELAAVVLLVLAAFRAWEWAIVPIELPGLSASAGAVTRLLGSWIALSVASATVAGLLALDALRQSVLAWRVRRRHAGAEPAAPLAGEA